MAEGWAFCLLLLLPLPLCTMLFTITIQTTRFTAKYELYCC